MSTKATERPEEAVQVAPSRHGMVALEGQGEDRRNRLLRRVDWRFLAGKPQPSRAWVPGGGMLAEALELVAEETLTSNQVEPGSVDLIAFTNPGRAELERAWLALEPGGVLYGEWYLPTPGGPGRLSRRLDRMGFQIAGSYWPWPWPERATPAFWLPLEAPQALRYFLQSRPPVASTKGRVLRSGLQYAWRAGRRAGFLAPVCIVAHKPLSGSAVYQLLPESLAARAARWGLAQDSDRLDWLLLTGGLHSTNKVTALVFRKGQQDPAYVVKMPRRDLSLPSLEREARVLQAVQAARSRAVTGIPELVFVDTQGSFRAIVETHLPGVPLYTAMQPDRLEALAWQAAGWLLELVEPGPPVPPGDWRERLVAPVLEDFAQGYAAAGGGPILDAIRPELESLDALPLAIEHRDFSPWNVFLAPSGDLSVLDWEGAEPRGLPFSDLLYFLTYLTFFAEGALESGSAPAAYRQMLNPQSRMGKIAAACIQEYCSAIGIPVQARRPLRLITWLRHAVLERKLIENSSTGEPDQQLLRRGLYLSLLQAELEMIDSSGGQTPRI